VSESGRYLLISVDCHAGPRAEDARDYALSEFTWPAVAEKYLGIYGVAGS